MKHLTSRIKSFEIFNPETDDLDSDDEASDPDDEEMGLHDDSDDSESNDDSIESVVSVVSLATDKTQKPEPPQVIITEPEPEPEETFEEASEESENFSTSAVSSLPEENTANSEKAIDDDVTGQDQDDSKGQDVDDAKDQRPEADERPQLQPQQQEDLFAKKAAERRKMLQSLMEENKSVLTNIVASEIKKRQESIDSGGELSTAASREAIQCCHEISWHDIQVDLIIVFIWYLGTN